VTDMQRMFQFANSFNQDLSAWDVGNVSNCSYFDIYTSAWTLQKPNFTNCNPN
jgi:surface protein